MERFKFMVIPGTLLALFLFTTPCLSQTPPASQTAGGLAQQEKEAEKQKSLEKTILKEKPSSEETATQILGEKDQGPKVLIEKIVVEDAVLLSEKEIQDIIAPFQEKELSLTEMQKVADLITDEYRKRGYVTSRAYLPPQTIREKILIIKVVEGKLGNLEIKGNRYFSTSLLEKKIGLTPKGYFDYAALQRALVYINESPDRMAKAVLVPGKEPGTTDIIVEVQDNFPFHAGYSFDNYGSRYINRYRHALILEHNNLLGHDDKLYVKAQVSDGLHLLLQQVRYVYPLSKRLELGGYFLFSKLKLGQEFADLNARGDAEIYGLFSNYLIVDKDNISVKLNLGFDSKTVTNELLGSQTSRDQLSVLKTGVDFDMDDKWGRTILTTELDSGIPDFIGSMDDKDADASRLGAGGKFTKGVFNLFRLQPMPFSTSLLWKNSFQFSNNTLAASEQFLIGGATSVRGYPPGEYYGDKGFYSALELSLPPYGLSKDIKVPLRKERLYDVLRFVLFWDIGMVNLKNPQAGEQENTTIRSAGFGGRLTLVEDLECRVEVGYPLGGPTPSDGNRVHTWVELYLKF